MREFTFNNWDCHNIGKKENIITANIVTPYRGLKGDYADYSSSSITVTSHP